MRKRLRLAFLTFMSMVPLAVSGAMSVNSQEICDVFCKYWFSPVLDFLFGFPVVGSMLIYVYLLLSEKIYQDSGATNIKDQLLMYIPLLLHIGFVLLCPGVKLEILLEEIQLIPISLLILFGMLSGASLTTYMPPE